MSLEQPNYNDPKDRELYDRLWDKDSNERTEKEDRFFKTMYHMEEQICHLD